MKYRTLAAALLLGSVMFTSCVDEFSELNSDPSTITKPDIRFCSLNVRLLSNREIMHSGLEDLMIFLPGRKQQFHQEVIQLVQIVRLMKPMVVVMK
ncbi:hypothetical protein NXW95_23060 [Phocaeicola vulgatus]|nr:hypothetical protein [Phocaeicola vulgatus]